MSTKIPLKIQGRAYVVKDNVDTDIIIPARYLTTMDPEVLKQHAFEDLDRKEYSIPFLNPNGSCNYRIIVAGKNFGCGSSREHAPIALHAAGIQAVVALSFARIYYRNSVNGGRLILPLESTLGLTGFICTGDELKIDLEGFPVLTNYSPGKQQQFPLKQFGPVIDILEAGGLTAYNKRKLGLA